MNYKIKCLDCLNEFSQENTKKIECENCGGEKGKQGNFKILKPQKMKTNIILQGDALTKLKELPDKSINMVMTSPPYWALRDYGGGNEQIWDGKENCKHEWITHKTPPRGGHSHPDRLPKVGFCKKCEAWKGQLGLEPTFFLYIKHLCDIFDEVKRCLRDDGTIWVNLGDTYNAGRSGGHAGGKIAFGKVKNNLESHPKQSGVNVKSMQPKSLVLIPDRFRIEMINRGWILRNKIIWHKPNCMPSSVKDRFTVDFEEIMLFSKKKSYYFETQYEKTKAKVIEPRMKEEKREVYNKKYPDKGVKRTMSRIKRTVWRICPKPFKESHFAVYPEELCETPISAGCPKYICTKCGKPKVLEVELKKVNVVKCNARGELRPNTGEDLHFTKSRGYKEKYNTEKNFKGYKTTCDCNVEFISGIVLDPFFGAGTTGLVALKQGKKFIGIELNPEYIEIAEKRLKPYLNQRRLT